MYEIYFYEDKNGNSPILEYIEALSQKTDKDSRINHTKINDYIEVLSEYGKSAGEPYVKHIDGDIWELRPIRGRIFLQVGQIAGLYCFIISNLRKPRRPRSAR